MNKSDNPKRMDRERKLYLKIESALAFVAILLIFVYFRKELKRFCLLATTQSSLLKSPTLKNSPVSVESSIFKIIISKTNFKKSKARWLKNMKRKKRLLLHDSNQQINKNILKKSFTKLKRSKSICSKQTELAENFSSQTAN